MYPSNGIQAMITGSVRSHKAYLVNFLFFATFLIGKLCQIYNTPFDVRFLIVLVSLTKFRNVYSTGTAVYV